MKKLTREEFRKLKSTDVYATLFFILYMIGKIPEYSTLVDMIYMFDKKTVLKLCEYFGGETIKIPTIKQLMKALRILSLYESIDIDNIPYEEAIKKHHSDKDEIKGYMQLKKLMEEYEIK